MVYTPVGSAAVCDCAAVCLSPTLIDFMAVIINVPIAAPLLLFLIPIAHTCMYMCMFVDLLMGQACVH